MKRGKLLNKNFLFIFIFIAIGMYLMSSGVFQTCSTNAPTLPAMDPEQIEPLKQYLISNHQTPQEFVIKAFANHDIIFLGDLMLGDFFCIKQNIDLVNQQQLQ